MDPKILKRSNCSVPQCSINKKFRPDVAFFSLPKNPERAQLWLSQIGVLNPDGPIFICEEHFEPTHLSRSNSDKKKLTTDAVPKLKLPSQIAEKTISDKQSNTFIMIESKELDQLVENEIKASLNRSSGLSLASKSALASEKMTSDTNLLDNSTRNIKRINTAPASQKNSRNYNNSMSISGNPKEATTSRTLSPPYTPKHVLGGMIKGASAYTLQIHAIQTQMHQLSTAKNRNAYLQLSLKLYLRFPKAYKHLQTGLKVPKKSDFKLLFKNVELSADLRNLFFVYLAHKAQTLTENQKQCFVCITEIKLKPRFYYDITKDRLLGIHDYDGSLKPEPATTAVVLIVQGTYCDWKQPIAVAYLADDTTSIKPWVVNNIHSLLNIGYNVQAIVCQKDSQHFVIRKQEYLKVNNKKVFCTYDIISLMKNLYYNFTQSDYYFDGGIVQCQDIIRFYKSDSKKEMPLNPKLSDKHLNPANVQELNIQTVMEVCCMTTAAAMSTYIDFGVLDDTAAKTVQFIVKMSEIFEVIYPERVNEKIKTNKDVASNKSQIDRLRELLELIESAHMVEPSDNPSIVKSHDKLLEKLNIFKHFILKLCEYSEYLPVEQFTAAAADIFSEQTKVHSKSITEPTARDVNTMFRQTAIINLLKNTHKENESIDMHKVLTEFQVLIKGFKPISPPDDGEPRDIDESDYVITSCEYNALELERKNGIIFIAGFLLKKCHSFHKCPDLNLCIYTTSKDLECLSMCESLMDDVRNGICNVPSTNFIEYVESMEIVFRTFMNKEILGSKYILAGLLSCLKSVDAPLPCKCFPTEYLKKLYTRFRIYHTLKFNNELIKSKHYKRLVVNRI